MRTAADDLAAFLHAQGLDPDGLDQPGTLLWTIRDAAGPTASAALEPSGRAALLRSVAVRPDRRGTGTARRLVEDVLAEAAAGGVHRVYLFSTDAGAFWQRMGFREVPVPEAAAALPDAPQVRRYLADGSLADEVAWCRDLVAP
ncbi:MULTISPECIES: GNAT family N-acetyltransferase [Kitasatospora]|uniref:Putative acetyltransferase n=1 Tax=Kitasatospora setae (strain ATCC 33774 / DSM 43861 / JCM 3304 / KCC A-0304 / NBRC 14216 / KM-6054) TaxID=452652 RepID=E4N6K0_KITSK|nr:MULTISPECIES: GNAT family N-acetyltransferase [Kitasatospora]BAJ26831.1 putative acetyltransferase [Kitasatospora setae KM-6054]